VNYDDALNSCIFRYVSGSYAYGTERPDSDRDYRGVFIAPMVSSFQVFVGEDENGLPNAGVQTVHHPKRDEELQELRKFLKLAADCNPNIIEYLYADRLIAISTPIWEKIRSHRDWFLSKKARFTFSGYCFSQLKRIRTHRGYILNPPDHKPTRAEFGLPETSTIDKEHRKSIVSIPDKWINPEAKVLVNAERAFESALTDWNAYSKWLIERNPYRRQLEINAGYDCYVADTEFLTAAGWKLFDQIVDEDKLATVYIGPKLIEHKPFTVEYQVPTERFNGTFSGNLYNLVGNHVDVSVTPNHKMLVKKVERKSKKEYGWNLVEAAALPDCFDVLNTIVPKTKTYQRSDEAQLDCVHIRPYLALMGWYLSDGCMTFRNSSPKSIRISQKKGGRLHWYMSRFHNKYKASVNSSLLAYQREKTELRNYEITEIILDVRNKEIVSKMYLDCGCRDKKRIPRWVFRLSKRDMILVLRGALLGDGTLREHKTVEDTWIYYSKLKGLADDIQELAFLCGFQTSLYGPYKQFDKGYDLDMYQVHIGMKVQQRHQFIRSSGVSQKNVKDQKIVCFTVPNGTLITRHNGHVGIHGNSKHATHLVRLFRMGKEILQDGEVHVYRQDRAELKSILTGEWSYDRLEALVAESEADLEALYKQSTLRDKPDRAAIQDLYLEICEEFYGVKLR